MVDLKNDGLSSERGSSYEVESWGQSPVGQAPLQIQVRELFKLINVDPKDVLSGNLIPFRSPRFADLPHPSQALSFGKNLWKDILEASNIELVITMGSAVTGAVGEVLSITEFEKVPSGWGNVSIQTAASCSVGIVGLPHLSTFKLFSRNECQAALSLVFENYKS